MITGNKNIFLITIHKIIIITIFFVGVIVLVSSGGGDGSPESADSGGDSVTEPSDGGGGDSDPETLTVSGDGTRYYLATDGNDSNDGSTLSPWATFDKAWQELYPGDTLVVKDGVYYQTVIPNVRNGTADDPITVMAEHDGKAIIDGEGIRTTFSVGFNGVQAGEYFIFEGLVVRNGLISAEAYSSCVIEVRDRNHVTFRRISAYDANPDVNAHVVCNWGGDYNTFEDIVAAGTGRKMMISKGSSSHGNHNVFRRIFTFWKRWDGRDWHDPWPWGEGFEIYSGNYNIAENIISFGGPAGSSLSLIHQDSTTSQVGNMLLGSIAMNTAMDVDAYLQGQTAKPLPAVFGCSVQTGPCDCLDNPDIAGVDVDQWCIDNNHVGIADRPQPNTMTTNVRDFEWLGNRMGISLYQLGGFEDIIIKDIISYNNAGIGLSFEDQTTGMSNISVSHLTMAGNGVDAPGPEQDADAWTEDIDTLGITDSVIDVVRDRGWGYHNPMTGTGADVTKRYVDGVKTSDDLWPWPMEQRIMDELGLSATCEIGTLINTLYAQGKVAAQVTPSVVQSSCDQ